MKMKCHIFFLSILHLHLEHLDTFVQSDLQ